MKNNLKFLILPLLLSLGLTPAVAASNLGGEQLDRRGIIVNYTEEIPLLPKAKVKSYVIANLNTGEILAAKNPHRQLPPASTIKALTAITLLDKLDPTRVYTARRADVTTYGTKVGLGLGRKYTIDDLWYGLLLPSANDVAIALANANGGMEITLKQMNQKAKALKALNTVAKTPHGLDTPGQVSTAYDLALIGRAAVNSDAYRKYARTMRYVFPKTGRDAVNREIANTNRLLTNYPGVIAGKTGFTTKARNTYIGAARRNGEIILISFMGAEFGRDALAIQLFDWGFAVNGFIEPVGKLVD